MPVRPVVALFRALVSVVGASISARVRAQIVSIWILTSRGGATIVVQISICSEQTLVALAAIALNKKNRPQQLI